MSLHTDEGFTKYHVVLAEFFNIRKEDVTNDMLVLGKCLRRGFKAGNITKDNILPYEEEYNRIVETLK